LKKILIVEDDIAIAEIERDFLEINGFEVSIEKDGIAGLNQIKSGKYDLVLLDLMLPGIDGFEICKQVRGVINIPIIMVTAKIEDVDKIRGLGLGGDDYITKPFAFAELLARVRAVLRRGSEDKDSILKVKDLEVNLLNREVKRGNLLIELTSKEFSLLEYFLRNKKM